jgi:hypothetical protein
MPRLAEHRHALERLRWPALPAPVSLGLLTFRLPALAKLLVLALAAAAHAPLLGSCGNSAVPSPFHQPDAGGDGSTPDAPATEDAAGDADPTIGGPCLDDAQCDDGIECTADACDHSIARCRFVPNHALCANTIYCDGEEVCDPKLGCRAGEPVACSDGNTCTIDACVEATRSCTHLPRDADSDGDPDIHCGGGDCNDTDPLISSLAAEVCANGKDDDCDGIIDEPDCALPEHDTCADALEIKSSGSFMLSLQAANLDYAASCVSGTSYRDVVVAIIVPGPGPADVDVIAHVPFGQLAIAAGTQCGDVSSELGCHQAVESLKSSQLARLRLRGLEPGAYPLYVWATGATPVTMSIAFLTPQPAATNETCGTAAALAAGAHVEATLIGLEKDLTSSCSATTGELVYELTLPVASDLDLYAISLDGWGAPSLSLRSASCSAETDELHCKTAQPGHLYARALAAGSYAIALSASAPTVVDLVAEPSPPTPAPADETCQSAPPLVPGKTLAVPLAGHTDDVKLGCVAGAADAAYALELAAASDVLLLARLSQGDTAGVLLAKPPCAVADDLIACGTAASSPVRAAAYGLPPGSYRAIVETLKSNPTELTAFVRPAAAPILVPFADTCDKAVTIPPNGGRLLGNTANASADYDAGCDFGGQSPGGAPEQMLRLVLANKRRVVLDMRGSAYNTLLDVRKGPSCPGSELPAACAAGYVAGKSFLDLTLEAGEYFVQVDGYAGAKGAWVLDVFIADPG